MAYHATPSLSFQPPLPSYPVVETDDVEHAGHRITGGGSAHVSTRAVAEQVLDPPGLGPERIEDLVHFGMTGRRAG